MTVITQRWRPPRVLHDRHENLAVLFEFLPRETFDARIKELRHLVRKKYPSSHLDYYIFALAIIFVIASAAFSLVARAAGVSMWYPLILLLFPASLSLWTSRRRATMVNRVKEFEKSFRSYLGDLNKRDASQHQIKWSVRRASRHDRTAMGNACLVIELAQCDPESEVDALPLYQEVEGHGNPQVMVQIDPPPAHEDADQPPNYTERDVVVLPMESMATDHELQPLSTSPSTAFRPSIDQANSKEDDDDVPDDAVPTRRPLHQMMDRNQ
ncbi:hypothetical protein NQZ79_g7919 [Umbelopsis isabellina]|nr:hypothetical protein NQZ79_g7919 [Umbelopsis isabellina]